jgi:predicted house-cleaning noncanonical NTP pyrophosphatase (MazG superfamily)
MFTPYDKIVRDKIPRLIESQGRKVKYSIASDEEAYEYLVEELFTKST